jgi:hypothetical protein
MNKRLSLLVLALSANSAPAQEISEAPEAAEIRRYTVEMIIFAYYDYLRLLHRCFGRL